MRRIFFAYNNRMMNGIIDSTNRAKEILLQVRKILTKNTDATDAEPLLKAAVCEKLMIPEVSTDDIRNLAVLSIKYMDPTLTDEMVKSKIEKYDCHQTNLVAQKKTLLILFIEKELGVRLSDDEAVEIRTIADLSRALKKQFRTEA